MKTMRYNRPIIAAVALLVAAFSNASAQTSTADVGFTPYSVFGFGDLAKTGTTYNKSMGGMGIGDRNVRYINILNPAAVTARESNSFMMDFGFDQNNVYFAGENAEGNVLKSANNTFNMDHIVLSFPIWKHSAFKAGIAPYSNTGYSFSSNETDDRLISEMGDINYTQIGQGGLSQAFVGAGVTLFKRLSLGVDGQYYFGSINRYTAASFTTASSYRSISSGWDYYITGLGAKFGLQYEQPLAKDYKVVVGATYNLGSSLTCEKTRYAYGIMTSVDTIFNNKEVLDDYSIPTEIGVGITFKHGEDWTVGFDYRQQDWTSVTVEEAPGTAFATSRMQSFSAGFEFTPSRYDSRYYYKHITYRGGCYYDKSFYTINGQQVDARGITLGISFPVFRYFNSVNLGVDMGQRGSLANGLVRERYFLFTVSFALHDIWFLKPMYD